MNKPRGCSLGTESWKGCVVEEKRTLYEFSTIDLTGCDLESDHMILEGRVSGALFTLCRWTSHLGFIQ